MRSRHTIFAASVLVGLTCWGCSNPEAAVIGDWTQNGQTMTVAADHTVKGGTGAASMEGSWSLAEKKLTVKFVKVGGKTVADIESQMDQQMKSNPLAAAQGGDFVKKIKDALDKGLVYTLSDDGKTITATNPLNNQTETATKVVKS